MRSRLGCQRTPRLASARSGSTSLHIPPQRGSMWNPAPSAATNQTFSIPDAVSNQKISIRRFVCTRRVSTIEASFKAGTAAPHRRAPFPSPSGVTIAIVVSDRYCLHGPSYAIFNPRGLNIWHVHRKEPPETPRRSAVLQTACRLRRYAQKENLLPLMENPCAMKLPAYLAPSSTSETQIASRRSASLGS